MKIYFDMNIYKLIKKLDYPTFLRLIPQMKGGHAEGYLKTKEKVFEGLSLDDIYQRAKVYWYSSESQM